MSERVELPEFIQSYLCTKLKKSVIVAVVSAIIAGCFVIHMSVTSLDSFMREIPPETETASFNINQNIRNIEFHNNHIARENYQTYRIFMSISVFALSVNAVFFVFFSASIWLNIKGHTFSRMYRILNSFDGEPQEILNHLENTLAQRKTELHSSEPFVNESFILIPYFSYVYIAPIRMLYWAYISLKATRRRYSNVMKYYLNFHFRENGEQSVKIGVKDDGIRFLQRLGRVAPHVSIGYNKTSHDSQKDII